MSRTATDTEIILLVEAIHDAIIAGSGGGGGGGGSIPIVPPTGNNGDIISTNAAGTQFNRVTTETLVPTSFEDLLAASPTIIALQSSSIRGRLTR